MLPWGGGGGADRSVVGGRAAGDKPATVEDVMPIATGLEREELAAELKVGDAYAFFFFSFFFCFFGLEYCSFLSVLEMGFVICRSVCGFAGGEAVRHGSSRRPIWYQGEAFAGRSCRIFSIDSVDLKF